LLEDTARSFARRWGVIIDGPFQESLTAWLCFGRRGDDAVVMKLPKPENDEVYALPALRHFAGSGAVEVLDHADGAMLLARAVPGEPLADLVIAGRDDDATALLCDVIADLHRPDLPDDRASRFPSIADWGNELTHYRDGAGVIPPAMIDRAIGLYADLTASQAQRRLLHGDLHHYNILRDQRRGWLAIDPKGVVGEPAYEVGAALRNPTNDPTRFAVRAIIERRVAIVCERLGFERERVLAWGFAQGILSAVWRLQGGRDPDRGLVTANAIAPLL
jgi:streptomycin 6-kinase